MIPWLVAIGLISMLGQVVLLRELNVAFYGSELIYVLALGVWMFWTAVGAALGRRARLPSHDRVRLLLLVHGWLLPLALFLVRDVRNLLGGVPGAYLPFPQQMLAMVVLLLPVGITLGLLFQWAAKLYVGERRSLAGAYAVESAGGVLGGLLATLLLVWGARNLTAALLCAGVSVIAACFPRRPAWPRWLAPAVAVSLVLVALGLAGQDRLDRALTARNHPSLLDTRDSPYGRVTVSEDAGQLSVFVNDALAFDTEGTAAEEFAHLSALQHPAPREVLLLGGGVEGVVRELLAHRPRSIDAVELDPVLHEMLLPHLPGGIRDSLRAANVRTIIDDPRRFLESAGRYDLILVGMPEPDSGRTNRFYTREFFAICADHLAPGGVLAFRLRGAENLWTPLLARRTASIHRGLREVFDDVVVLPGVTNLVLASDSPLIREPAALGQRLRERAIEARLVIPAYVDYLYTNDRFAEIAGLLESAEVPVNRDSRPICYQYTMLLWLSQFWTAAGRWEPPALTLRGLARSPFLWIPAALLCAAMLLARRRSIPRRALLAAVAGCAGMVLETVLILHYQVQRGVLYQDLGLLLTLFMAGLALGAGVLEARSRSAGGDRAIPRLSGGALVSALALLGLLTAWLLDAGKVGGLGGSGLLLLAGGALVAGVFAYASVHRLPDQRAVIAPLYSSDLMGGSLGSLAASLALIPALGLTGSALLTALFVALALLLV
jgi:spermidine synthase